MLPKQITLGTCLKLWESPFSCDMGITAPISVKTVVRIKCDDTSITLCRGTQAPIGGVSNEFYKSATTAHNILSILIGWLQRVRYAAKHFSRITASNSQQPSARFIIPISQVTRLVLRKKWGDLPKVTREYAAGLGTNPSLQAPRRNHSDIFPVSPLPFQRSVTPSPGVAHGQVAHQARAERRSPPPLAESGVLPRKLSPAARSSTQPSAAARLRARLPFRRDVPTEVLLLNGPGGPRHLASEKSKGCAERCCTL